MRQLLIMLAVCTSIGVLMAELGSNVPSDDKLLAQRVQEGGSLGSGIFDIAPPPPDVHGVHRRLHLGQGEHDPSQLSRPQGC